MLPDSYNRTHEHAVLGKQDLGADKKPKGLRISINTKKIRPEDFLYLERENRTALNHGDPIPLFQESVRFPTFQSGTLRKTVNAKPANEKPRVWCCRAGKQYPPDAVYVGCLTAKFSGTIYGNDHEPFKGHKKWIATNSAEFRKYAKKKMQDRAFRAQAIKDLRGKHLLCWCLPEEPFCHARVWLEIVNRPEYGGKP